MNVLQLHVLLLITLVAPTLISATTPAQNYPIAKPGCNDSCGNISIPFPFGTSENCYRNITFLVTCTETFDPPKLFLGTSDIEIKKISLKAGQLNMMRDVVKICYDQYGTLTDNSVRWAWMRLNNLYAINNTANKFTVVGCDSYGYISGRRWGSDRYYSTGCITTCQEENDVEDGTCTGSGCCQISQFPDDGSRLMNLTTGSFSNHTNVRAFSNCTYAFLAEDGFKFHRENLTNLVNTESLPIVVDWVISNETCRSAGKNVSNYACQYSNSECVDIGRGYRCQCKKGYEGNPYLLDGCIDINECNFPGLHNCHKYNCKNSNGSFTCECPYGFHGNATREGGCVPVGTPINDSPNGELPIYKPIAGALLGIILVILLLSLVYLKLKRRKEKKMKHVYFLRNGGMLLKEKLTSAGNMLSIGTQRELSSNKDMAKIFSSTELQHATDDFHDSRIVGQGGFGTVYKGFLHDNRIVAIKKSKEVDPGQIDQFINEVVVLSRVSHRNIVKLLGCCLETQAPLLVYEYINNGTLHEHLHNQAKRQFLDWSMRLKIATETADVLQYLHSAATIPIIHRDVKSANILLDQTFEAKVSDFGASRLVPVDQTQLSTMVQGTFGYLDPEYMQTNQLTEKSDVYSFGVVLVELITGMKPLSYDRPEEQRNLTSFFLCKVKQGGLLDILDESIVRDKRNLDQITEVAKLARVCLNVKGQDRPSMKEVAMELEGLRSGGKHSWVKFEENVEEMEPLCGDALKDSYASDNCYSTSVGYISFRDQANLNDGR